MLALSVDWGHMTSLGRAAEMAVIVERHQMPQMA
jgi:hypothetical protein